MSGQEPAFLQGTQERAAWALLAEQLLPPLPKPAFLAALIRDRWSRELWEQREMAREVLAAEKHGRTTFSCLMMRISGGSKDSPPLQPRVIVPLQGSSQRHPEEIQRETLPKTVGDRGSEWPALNERTL